MSEEDRELARTVVCVKQTINNACGFYAFIHAVCNLLFVEKRIIPALFFSIVAAGQTVEQRVQIIETIVKLENAYVPNALQGQTEVSETWHAEVSFPYTCFLEVNGRIWELGGDKKGPVDQRNG
jgi:ubiquitin carboxyl-terminal hydrolase L3